MNKKKVHNINVWNSVYYICTLNKILISYLDENWMGWWMDKKVISELQIAVIPYHMVHMWKKNLVGGIIDNRQPIKLRFSEKYCIVSRELPIMSWRSHVTDLHSWIFNNIQIREFSQSDLLYWLAWVTEFGSREIGFYLD